MTIIAKRTVQLNGHIYSKGEAAEYNGPVDSRIADLFTDKDGEPLSITPPTPPPDGEKKDGEKKDDTPPPASADASARQDEKKENTFERIDKLVKQIGRKGIEQKLDELGINYKPKMNDSQLALLLLQQQGEVEA